MSASGSRTLHVVDMFLSYKKVDMRDDEIITSIFVPYTKPTEYVSFYKQSRRRDDDLAIVNCCFSVDIKQHADENKWIVSKASFCFGGMAATLVSAKNTMEFLNGKDWLQVLRVFKQGYDLITITLL